MSVDVASSDGLPEVGSLRQRVSVRQFLRARAIGRLDIETRFFSALRVPGGVYKSTAEHRLDDTTEVLLRHIKPSNDGPLRVLDVGCSSGITTVELFETLRARGILAEVIGTDRAVRARHVEREDGCATLFDSRGELLQIDIGDYALPAQFRYGRRAALQRPLTAARALWLRSRDLDAFRGARQGVSPSFRATEIELISGRVLQTPEVTVIEEDAESPQVAGRVEVVRAANVLNLGYYDDSAITRMLERIGERLVPGGLLVVARTVDRTNHATVFRLVGNRFVSVEVLRQGTEIMSLVERARVAKFASP